MILRTVRALGWALGVAGTPLAAQARTDPAVVSDVGLGTDSYVLISGMVGGVAGFRRLEQRLLTHGYRVVIIDPYRLSVDSADVSFAALARRVERVLVQRGVSRATIIAHAHGAGVALRLAAAAPERVEALYFLDVGALASNSTTVLNASLRLVPLIARVPAGRDFIRKRYIQGLRQNAAQVAWLDSATQAAYADSLVHNTRRAVALAFRMSRAQEPEPLEAVVSRIVVPVTVLLGAVTRPSGPGAAELTALAPLGALVRIERLDGVGHFPHEEAPDEVMRRVLRRSMPCGCEEALSTSKASS